jgi:polysaccharide pyruvyl transferase WcaK-like protein
MTLVRPVAPPPPPRRVCILNFTGERQNWGCRATSWELVRVLNRQWTESEPFALETIPLLPHHALDVRIPEQHCDAIHAALLAVSPSAEQRAAMLALARTRYGDLLERVIRADLVLFQGEGTMTGTDFLRAERLLLLPWVAQHALGKPVVWVNQTLFSAEPVFSEVLLHVLAGVPDVWVREPASLEWLRRHGCGHTRLVPDTAFLTDPLDHGDLQARLSGREYFCVTGSAALFGDAIPAMLAAIRTIADRTGLLPVFACSVGRDLRLADAAAESWPGDSHCRIPVDCSYPAVAHHLANARLLVGGRYHLSILAAIGGTPSALLDTNTYKLHGLVDLLDTTWPVRSCRDLDRLVDDAVRLAGSTATERAVLRQRVATLRGEVLDSFADWPRIQMTVVDQAAVGKAAKPGLPARERGAPPAPLADYGAVNRRIAELFTHPEGDSPAALFGPPPPIQPQLQALTLYLRRGVHTEATFRCLRQLVEGNLDLVLDQLNARWLVSICDSYADHGDPVTARNAALISTFLTWERLAATHARWADPTRTTNTVSAPVPERNVPLWDGLVTVHLARGDTTCNLLARSARLLAATPHLLRIWRELLARIRRHDSVLAALNEPHGHLFDEDLAWLADERIKDVPAWRRPGRRPGHDDSADAP